MTFNEPRVVAALGYDNGFFAPGRCSKAYGNSATEPYIVSHNLFCLMLRQYRDIVRIIKFIHPIVYGEYPKTMQEILSHRLPKFTNKEVKMVKGSIDFVGVNQYTAYYMYDARQGKPKVLGYQQDWNASFACVDDPGNVTLAKGLHDTTRINYYKAYSTQLKRAIDDGANVEGYFAWSLLDNFEWRLGYTSSCSLMFALGMFCCWEAAYVSSVAVSGVLIMSLPCCLGKLLTFRPLPSLEC